MDLKDLIEQGGIASVALEKREVKWNRKDLYDEEAPDDFISFDVHVQPTIRAATRIKAAEFDDLTEKLAYLVSKHIYLGEKKEPVSFETAKTMKDSLLIALVAAVNFKVKSDEAKKD